MPGTQPSLLLLQLRRMVGVPTSLQSPDGLLLKSFIAERDQAAFECLLKRHAPMVHRTCLRIVRDPHHAEDAFQATFLVLCRKAGSIRSQQSVAGWLYQVAARIALRMRKENARQIAASNNRIPELAAPESGSRLDDHDVRKSLDEVMSKLPDKYRTPLILHYLEGKTAVDVASELGWPYGTVLVRLARGRDKLRARCARNGLALGAESMWATELVRFAGECSLPAGLAKSTTKVALLLALWGYGAPSLVAPRVAELAEGMRQAMLMAKLKAGIGLLLVVAGLTAATVLGLSYRTAAQTPEPVAQNRGAAKLPLVQAQPKSGDVKYQMTGSVCLEKTGEPVAGATIAVMTGEGGKEPFGPHVTAKSGKDGLYFLTLGAGHFQPWFLTPPPGYWLPIGNSRHDSMALTPAVPVVRRDYLVRRGTRWNFRIVPGANTQAGSGIIFANSSRGFSGHFRSVVTDAGLLCLTLPTEAGQVSANILEDIRDSGYKRATLEWDSDFRTDSVKSISRTEASSHRFRLTDAVGKTAFLSSTERLEPILEGEHLVIRVELQKPDPKSLGELTGQVLDETGKPLEMALVSMIYVSEPGSAMSADKYHHARTDAEGRFLLRSVPRISEEKPLTLQLAVTRPGFAGIDTKTIRFEPPPSGPQKVAPIRLSPGFSVNGVVLDREGKPAAGVWVRPGGSYASRSQFTKTDEHGHFVVRDLPAGIASLAFTLGNSHAASQFWAERDPKPGEVRLKSLPAPGKAISSEDAVKKAEETRKAVEARRTSPPNPGVGALAPEWETSQWSDGKARKLNDYQGKVVFLDFWGIWCGPCMHGLPIVDKLRTNYEKRGVVFLSIHTPGDDSQTIRKVLDSKKVSLTFALDIALPRVDIDKVGVSSERFGIFGYPTYFLIDQSGKIAFRSDDPKYQADFLGIVKALGFDEKTITEDQASQVIERFLEQTIEKIAVKN